MGVCNQVAFLILYYITSRLVPLHKVTDAPIQVPNVLDLIVRFEFLHFSSHICLLLFLKCQLTSRFTLFRLSTLLSLESCIHFILARFLWSKKHKYSSSNQGLFCLNSYKLRLSFAEVWIFSNVLPSNIYVFVTIPDLQSWKPVCKINLILFLNSGSFSFLKLNLCLSTSVRPVYSLLIFPSILQSADSCNKWTSYFRFELEISRAQTRQSRECWQ